MRSVLSFAVGIAVVVVAVVVLLVVSRRARRELDTYLGDHGFAADSACHAVVLNGRPLQGVTCYRGAVAPGVTGQLFVGFIAVPSKRGINTRYLGVAFAPPRPVDDAWLARFSDATAYRASDNTIVIAWPLLDTPDNAAHVLDEVAAALR